VVVVTPDGFDGIHATVAAVRRPASHSSIELIVVTPARGALALEPALADDFWGVQVAEATGLMREARAIGVRRARAPAVAFAEEHSFVDPGWAEALIAAHRGPWAAVGPAAINANPGSSVSWTNVLSDFGDALLPVAAGPAQRLMSHNVAYKRAVLLEYGLGLGAILANEHLLFRDLLRKGHQLYLEPAAQVRHFNVSRWPSMMINKFHAGRIMGAMRVHHENWRPSRRLVYALLGPLIGLSRLRYVLSNVYRTGRQRELLPRLLPALLTALWIHGLGEAVGCMFGPGPSPERWSTFEFYRRRHLNERDQRTMSVR
jgi:hypothetical protein